MNKLHIVTVATEIKFYMPYLIETCKNNGVELTILGLGKKWKGFTWRFKMMLNFLKNLDKNDIVCFVDGYDVICIRNLKDLPSVFFELKNKHNCKIIVGEDPRYDENSIINSIIGKMCDFYYSRCKNEPINAGTYIGLAGDLLEVLTNILKLNNNSEGDDQVLLTKYCKNNPDFFYIDKSKSIFLVMFNAHSEIDHKLTFENNQISYKKKLPFFIHAPGETYLDNIIKKIDKNYNDNIKYELKKNFIKKIKFRVTNSILLKNILIVLLFAFIIVCLFQIKKLKK